MSANPLGGLKPDPVEGTPWTAYQLLESRVARDAALTQALAAFQGAVSDPVKSQSGQVRGKRYYRYAGLQDVLEAVRPVLSEQGLAISQAVIVGKHGTMLRTRLLHRLGGCLESFYPLEFKGGPQERGSELTYAKRYSLEAILGVSATDDDDADQAQDQAQQQQQPQNPSMQGVRPKPMPKPAPKQTQKQQKQQDPAAPNINELIAQFQALNITQDDRRALRVHFDLRTLNAAKSDGNAVASLLVAAKQLELRREMKVVTSETEKIPTSGLPAAIATALEGQDARMVLVAGLVAGLPITDKGPKVDGAPDAMLRRYLHELKQTVRV